MHDVQSTKALVTRASVRVRVCLVLLCVAILVARLSGAHLHLCFDGSEPFESLQMNSIVGAGSQSEVYKPRHDLDLDFVGEALAKKLDGSPELMLLAATAFLLNKRFDSALAVAQFRIGSVPRASGFPLRPPQRGPPQ